MFTEAIELSVAPGPHEPDVFSARGQAELQRFHMRLRVDGTCVEAVTFRSADGSGLTGVFVIPPAQPPGPALPEVLAGWLHGGAGRTLRIRTGAIEAEACTAAEIGQLLRVPSLGPGQVEDPQ